MKKIGAFFIPLLVVSLFSSCNIEKKLYTVTWKNYNGEVLEVDNDVLEGAIPSYNHNEPTRPGDQEYSYTFTGWDNDITKGITQDTTFTACYKQNVIEYVVTFKKAGDNDIIRTFSADNLSITAPKITPTCDGRWVSTNPYMTIDSGQTISFTKDDLHNWTFSFQAHKIKEEIVDVYQLGESGNVKVEGETRSYYFFNDSVIPYQKVDDFVINHLHHSPYYGLPDFCVETKNNQSIFTNLSSQATAVIDYESQSVTYSDLTAYFHDTNHSYVPVGCDFGGNEFFIGDPTSERTEHHECVISLADYHQHVYLIDGVGYIPEIFMFNVLAPVMMEGVIFNGENCYIIDGLPGLSEQFDNGVKEIREQATIFNQEYMQYNYDILAFMFDFRYGLTGLSHVNRNPSAYEPTHTFFKDGAYAILEKYKDKICSTEINTSSKALLALTVEELNDGGHSFYAGHNIFNTHEWSDEILMLETLSMMYEGDESCTTRENFYLGVVASYFFSVNRNKTLADPTIMTGDENAKAGFAFYPNESNNGKVAYMVFDQFISPYESNYSFNRNNINESNYYHDTISLVHWANAQLKNNPDVKNLVIDLSCNGGGNAYTEEFIASWLCGGTSKLNLYNKHDGSIRTLVRQADVNLDGKFDDNDYLSSDYNVYCLFSNGSFSCGNLLPCDLKDHATVNLHLMGTKTGGGCCSVEGNHYSAIGDNFTLSSLYTLCREGSTPNNVVTVEDGVTGDYDKYPFDVGDELNNPGKFFAVQNIVNAILSN